MAVETILSGPDTGIYANGAALTNGVHPAPNGIALKNNHTASSQDIQANGEHCGGDHASEISSLAALIASKTAIVDDYLKANHLAQPSFHEDGPIDLKLSQEAEKARNTIMEASLQMHDLLRGPVELLRPTARCFKPRVNAVSLEAIYKYDIASKVPIHGEISFDELARLTEIYEPDLRRILRFAIVHHHVFQEHKKNMISHSAASRRLAEDSATQDAMGLMFGDAWQSFARTVEAMETFKSSQEPTETGFCLAHDTQKSVFDYLEAHPAKAKRFAGAMTSFATYPGNAPEFLVKGYRWASLGNATVVDVGGSEGKYSVALAQAFPDLNFIVEDLPEVVKAVQAKPRPAEVADRITFLPHDMFKEQPVSADIYLFRWIFHDWPDKYVIKILSQLIPAMKTGARVLISEVILPEPNTLPLLQERKVRALDMVMLSFFNSREREKDDWVRIWQSVDKRFRFVDAWTPKGAALGIIEAVWEG